MNVSYNNILLKLLINRGMKNRIYKKLQVLVLLL